MPEIYLRGSYGGQLIVEALFLLVLFLVLYASVQLYVILTVLKSSFHGPLTRGVFRINHPVGLEGLRLGEAQLDRLDR